MGGGGGENIKKINLLKKQKKKAMKGNSKTPITPTISNNEHVFWSIPGAVEFKKVRMREVWNI